MTDTTNLGLPFIEGGQAQKHVTHNEALRILDAVIQIAVLDMTRTTPPGTPAEGERYVVAAGATGAWTGYANAIATWQGGAWTLLAPKVGWCLWSVADASIHSFDGTEWQKLGTSADNVGRLGVNTTASAPNLMSVKSNAALFAAIGTADGGSGDSRVQVSKEAASNTASVFFSDNYSGRAEFGLTGNDDFHLKVSPDGASWQDAFVIDQTTAKVSFKGFVDTAATRTSLQAAPVDALGSLNMFPNGGFEGGAEASASAITLNATSTLQTVAVVDGVAAAYRGSFAAAVQQVASPFVGGRYALKVSVTLAQASLGANDELSCVLTVPGLQSAKLALGTANARSQSLGFWIQAHRTGVYSGSIRNSTKARSYPFSFSVTAADTPQWVSLIGIVGDTSGTWAIDSGAGILVTICVAAGTSRLGTSAAWASADYSGVTGTTNGAAATSDVFYIGNVISLPGDELPDSARAVFAVKPRNDVVRTDVQSLSTSARAQVKANIATGCFSAHKGGTDQTGIVGNGSTNTSITFETTVFNEGGCLSASVYTPPAGKVLISAQIYITGSFPAGSLQVVALFKNGVDFKDGFIYATAANNAIVPLNVIDHANGTDFYEIRVRGAASSGTLTVSGDSKWSFFAASSI